MTQEPQSSEPDAGTPEPVDTGVPAVDEVLRAVEDLEERPIEEHVGVFEAAQRQLRAALDADPSTDPDPRRDPS